MIDDPEIPRLGVIPIDQGSTLWRVWAPRAQRVDLVLGGSDRQPMEAEGRGYFGVRTEFAPEPASRYAFSLDGGPPLPDPCSRWQPDGIDSPSAVFFPERFVWEEAGWSGINLKDLVFYELHVGTFTPEGTFDAVIPRLPALHDLGITAIELMPVGQFPGSRSWGYDGVLPFAPQNTYGGPEGLQRLVQACHREGMAVFLDVIYNHFGPDGNVFPIFGHVLNERYKTDWGPALNYDGRGSDAFRAIVLENARYWVRDYRIDGLRLDAADQIFDMSPSHILGEVASVVHAESSRLGRHAFVFAETDLNNAGRFLRPSDRCGFGHDGHWNDDFHHAVHSTLTGETNGYYSDFAGGPRALAKVFERVFVNDGVYSPFRERRHGASATEFPGDRFVAFVQNHDQVGNRLRSDRYAASLPASAVRLAAGLLLLAPRLPLLFMGEEYGETHPFPFFCDFTTPELIEAVRAGRKSEFAYFGWQEEPPDPFAPATRDGAVLSWSWEDDSTRIGLRRLYGDLLRLRRESPILRDFQHARTRLHGDPDRPDVLEVIRGGAATSELRIIFNLSGEPRPLPADLAGDRAGFRSESRTYGATETDSDRPNDLRPHEFRVYGPLFPEPPR